MESDKTVKLDERIEKILNLNLKLIKCDARVPGNISENPEQLDAIINGLEEVSDVLNAQSTFIEERTQRLNKLVDLLLNYTLMDFSQQIEISERGDELDAIGLGLNTLGEELDSHINQLKERTDDLLRSNKQLEQFVYIASHDLQEPLRTLSNYVNLFRDDYKENLGESSSKYLEVISNSTERMRLLITDLLEYARVGEEHRLTVINCNELLNEVEHDLEASIYESNTTINTDNLPVITANYSELKSLFQNLISNAIKFKKANEPPVIHITALENDEYWTFEIRDNGIGMENQYLDRIFSIFQRLHSKKQYAGTGIGLAHCKKIVELHRGRIWVNSEFGKGSNFYFTIAKNLDKWQKS